MKRYVEYNGNGSWLLNRILKKGEIYEVKCEKEIPVFFNNEVFFWKKYRLKGYMGEYDSSLFYNIINQKN